MTLEGTPTVAIVPPFLIRPGARYAAQLIGRGVPPDPIPVSVAGNTFMVSLPELTLRAEEPLKLVIVRE